MRSSFLLLPLLLAVACSAPSTDGGEQSADALTASATAKKLQKLGAKPCADDKKWLCHHVTVPLDHANPGGKKIDVAFAVHPAPDATRKGTLARVTGGPGYAGLDTLGDLGDTDKQIPKAMDVVRFDLRGVKRSGALECKKAAGEYYLGGLRTASAADEARQTAKAKAFAAACVKEMGIPSSEVQFYSTDQAIEDLEAIRALLGQEKIVLYGLSYGTQFAQTYTKNHLDRVERLVIDGVVDLTLRHIPYMTNLNDGITKLLDLTLDDCAKKPACLAPFAGAPGATDAAKVHAAYAAVASELDATSKTLSWKKKDGSTSPRTYSRVQLDTTTFNAVGTPETRLGLQKALGAAFKQHDFMPLLKLSYDSAELDGDTAPKEGTAGADPDMSDAMYYAFTCNDYGLDASTEAAREKLYLEAGRKLWSDARVLAPYYGDLPCMYWPTPKKAEDTPALKQHGVPVMVVGATGDGATPVDMGEATAKRHEDGFIVTVEGGSHVMWGGGNACADGVINPFVLEGKRPTARATRCAGTFVTAE